MITVHITYYSVQDVQALKEFFCVFQCALYTHNTRIGHIEMHQRKQFFMQPSSFGHHFSCARNSTWIKINDFHFTLLCFSDRIKITLPSNAQYYPMNANITFNERIRLNSSVGINFSFSTQ